MTKIPLLIQEKLDYYLWKNRVKELHNEYNNVIFINKNGFLTYKCKNGSSKYSDIEIYCTVNNSNCRYYFERALYINKFNDPNNLKKKELPTKYNYSSGLEYHNGYRISFFQKLLLESQKIKSEKLLEQKLEQKLLEQQSEQTKFIIHAIPLVILYFGIILYFSKN
jgi:hypothetical protein